MAPNPFATDASAPAGRDCTAIENVDVVQCADSACVVKSCQPGFVVNAARDGCVAPDALKVQRRMRRH